MKQLILQRISDTEWGTFGVLKEKTTTIPFAVTLEHPWRENKQDVSCIPAGWYECKRIISPTFNETFEILDVKNRTHVLFHWGNWLKNTKGCVLVGESFEILDGKPAIASSKKGFGELMSIMEGQGYFELYITWVF